MTESQGGHNEVFAAGSQGVDASPGTANEPAREPNPIQEQRLSLQQVAHLTAMTPRNVRAYQQRGLIPPPTRIGRNAYYGWEHVSRLRLVSALHEHGLTLKVISDLVDRGTADAELARLGREELSATWSKSVRVPMADVLVEWMHTHRPGGMESLEEKSLVEKREDGRYYANAAGLGVTSALSKRGLLPDVGARVAIGAADAAGSMVEVLLAECKRLSDQLTEPDERREVGLLLMQMAAIFFADTLHSRLVDCLDDVAQPS